MVQDADAGEQRLQCRPVASIGDFANSGGAEALKCGVELSAIAADDSNFSASRGEQRAIADSW
jgi:hypothetical protein